MVRVKFNHNHPFLTNGKIYDVIEENETQYYIKNDKEYNDWYPKQDFTEVKEEQNIKKIICDVLGHNYNITIGNVYDVLDENRHEYFIVNDIGNYMGYHKVHFTELPELTFPREVMVWDYNKKDAVQYVMFGYNENLENPFLFYSDIECISQIAKGKMGITFWKNFCEIDEYKQWQEEQQAKVTLNGVPMTIEEALNELKAKQL
jgi:hypothetical protein